MEDIDRVVQIDRLSFSLPWPISAYRYEVEENLRSIKLVAEVPTDIAMHPMASLSPTLIKNDGHPGKMNTDELISDGGSKEIFRIGFSIVGMIVTWMIVDEAHIATIAVHPDFRRQGIAKLLVTAGLDEAIKLKMKTATLEVRAGNMAAQALYRQFGFESVGIRPRYYKDNANGVTAYEDAIIMTRRLI
jgi:ribosomal-protein-alanine N-acetyltransferase